MPLEESINNIIISSLEAFSGEIKAIENAMNEKIAELKSKYDNEIKFLQAQITNDGVPGKILSYKDDIVTIAPFSVSFGDVVISYVGGDTKITHTGSGVIFIQMSQDGLIYSTRRAYDAGVHRIGTISVSPTKVTIMQNVYTYGERDIKPRLVSRKMLTDDYSHYLYEYDDGKKLIVKKSSSSGDIEVLDNGEVVKKIFINT